MFTGIITNIGNIEAIKRNNDSISLSISVDDMWQDIELGESISVNGVCLTVVNFNKKSFSVDVSKITLQDSNISLLKKNYLVNLERSLKVDGRLGGHFVQGHVDIVGKISKVIKRNNFIEFDIKYDSKISKYLVLKGPIAVDGVSLTIQKLEKNIFTIYVVPHSVSSSTMNNYRVGSVINLEVDILAKYIEKNKAL